MVYVLEFFTLGPDGRRTRLDHLSCRAPTVERAADQARTIGKNIKMRDRRPQLCVIKDYTGTVFAEVGPLDHRLPQVKATLRGAADASP